ncbi:MAG TPA: PhoH family protein, partial [Fibrobacteraceae bacterium]|nr:PhoH family protein [Fibrobacteraceae bacterium]
IQAKAHPKQKVVLISKDVNLRMKARSLGLHAEDYLNDQVPEISLEYKGFEFFDHLDHEIIDRLYSNPFEVDADEVNLRHKWIANEYLVLRNSSKSVLARFDPQSRMIQRIEKVTAYGIKPRNAEQNFALNALMDPNIPLVTISGKAGTGKTLLALAGALERRKNYRQIYIARPVVPLSNKDIGYLPGDVKSKLDPYMQPLFDNLGVIQNQFPQTDPQYQKIKELIDEEKLKINPLSYIRGRSLVKVYFIIDEAQNLTPHEVKTIITRAGEGTKVVFTGDIYQIDHPYLDTQSNGMAYLIEKMRGQELYAHINLEKGERSQLSELASNLL